MSELRARSHSHESNHKSSQDKLNEVKRDDIEELFSILPRAVNKKGFCNLRKVGISKKLAEDLLSGLSSRRWGMILFISCFVLLGSWGLFGVLYWLVALAHGDIKNSSFYNEIIEPCVSEMDGFLASFTFSIETQLTIGYGTRTPSTECPAAILLLCVQSLIGLLIESYVAEAVFNKAMIPKQTAVIMKFSKQAVVFTRNGGLVLMFRIRDVWRTALIGCSVQAWILQHRVTKEGEVIPYYRRRLKLSIEEGGGEDFSIQWPVQITHSINKKSPMWDIAQNPHESHQYEIVVCVTCSSESTGHTREVRTSYIPSEIFWNYRFKRVLNTGRKYMSADYGNFDELMPAKSIPMVVLTSDDSKPDLNFQSELTPPKERKSRPSIDSSRSSQVSFRTTLATEDNFKLSFTSI